MDYEQILFGLQPILNADSVVDIPLQDIYVESYLKVLDQLAVHLRAPTNRDIVRETGLLSNLLRVLDNFLDLAIHDSINIYNLKYWQISSELIRCIANCLVDNKENRKFLWKDLNKKNTLIEYYIPKIIKLNELNNDSDDPVLPSLQMRSIVLLKNLSIENEEYINRIGPNIKGPLVKLLENNLFTFAEDPEAIVLASDLILEISQAMKNEFSINDISILVKFVQRVSSLIEDVDIDDTDASNAALNSDVNGSNQQENSEIEDDPNSEIIFSLVEALENILSQESLSIDFGILLTKEIQQDILLSLDRLNGKQFPQKLIIMRRLMSISGYISSHSTSENIQEREMCYKIINHSSNGYTIATSLILLSNSINSSEDVKTILKEVSIEQIIQTSEKMEDPMEFQGFLDILKKLLNLNTAMFLRNDSIKQLFQVLKMCSDQTQYIPQLSNLLDNLLKKLITVLPSRSIYTVIDNDDKSIALQCVLDRGSFISCLLMDKLLINKTKTTRSDILNLIWDSIFQFKEGVTDPNNNGISIPFLFQLTKTLGIYFKNCDSENLPIVDCYVITKCVEKLLQIIEILLPLKENQDNGSASVYHNGQFMCGMIINIMGKIPVLTSEEETLKNKCAKFF